MKTTRLICFLTVLLLFGIAPKTSAQITNVIFFDDFEDGVLDTSRYVPDAPFFEGGKGDITSTEANGVLEFTGTVAQQWWAGATLRVLPQFTVSPETNIVVSVDRVSETGEGTASRSALWIMDSTQTKYVLFADVRAEGGWRFNRKIGVGGDNPTGSGTDIVPFNPAEFDDGGLHQMKAVANGKTVKLYVDNIFGAEVNFPFSSNLIFQLGSYARANGDTAHTVFDNFKIESVGNATFQTTALTLGIGQTAPNITVRIPPGLNTTAPVQVQVISTNPAVAIPVGGVNGALTLTFPAGGPNTQTFAVQALATGGARFNITNNFGLAAGNNLAVTVILGPGVRLEESFAGALIDSTKWQTSDVGLETGTGTFTVTPSSGALEISGTTDVSFWAGNSLKTVQSYTATKDLNLSVEVDRATMEQIGSAGRSGVYLTTEDRSRFVFFGENVGETGWEVNVNPGNPTGSGTAIPAFASMTNNVSHRIKLVADGEFVNVYLDGQFGGRYEFAVNSGIFVELGAYARDVGDTVKATFDNVKIENTLPCIMASTSDIAIISGESSQPVRLTIPRLLNNTGPAVVTVTSRNPGVAIPAGAVGGVLTLTYGAGTTNVQSFNVNTVGTGTATFDIAGPAGSCVDSGITVSVTAAPATLLSDDFAAPTIDPSKWLIDMTPLQEGGTATAESGVVITNGQVVINVTAETGPSPGIALVSSNTYSAGTATPLTFEIDRVLLDFVLVTGTAAKERAGIWVSDADRANYVFFSEYATHDGTAGGWSYNRMIGQAGDNPTGAGVAIQAFSAANFNDNKNHRMKVVVNGATVKLFLDGVQGPEVPFPFSQGIKFGFGAYVEAATDVVTGVFDNAKISGGTAPTQGGGSLTVTRQAGNGSIVISWTGQGTLQSTDAIGSPTTWANVTPAPSGNSATITPSGQQKFYRLLR